MEDDEHPTPPLLIPERFFVFGEESVGVRVTPYHKPSAIRQILNALDTKEVDTINLHRFSLRSFSVENSL